MSPAPNWPARCSAGWWRANDGDNADHEAGDSHRRSREVAAFTGRGEVGPDQRHRRIVDAEDTEIFAAGTLLPDIMDGLARALYAPQSLPGG